MTTEHQATRTPGDEHTLPLGEHVSERPEHHASRTLVKSPPELWAECSDAASLARHLNQSFGEIRITRLEPESSVVWEGERASGTVRIEPSGWGTRVTLTAQPTLEEQAVEPADPVEEGVVELADPVITNSDPVEEEADAKVEETFAQPDPAVEASAAPARRRWDRLIGRARALFSVPGDIAPPIEDPPAPREATVQLEMEASESTVHETPPALDAPREETPPPEPSRLDAAPSIDPDAILAAALDSLGQAHHRPFSRA
jgi:hypothetical protein